MSRTTNKTQVVSKRTRKYTACKPEDMAGTEGREGAKDRWFHVKNIGAGGFGVVKLFSNQSTGAQIVLKELRLMLVTSEINERWLREMEILLRLDHPHIVKALPLPEGLDYMHSLTNTPYICMEYCDGGDLRQVLRDVENCCGLNEERIRQICWEVNSGIKFLHSEKVIHRDLKPENILIKLLGGDKVVYKLTDFGYAKTYESSSVCTSLVGTMQYVAPEVLRDKRYNSSVDFWSFGVVVFECITGKRPFFHGDPPLAMAWVDWVAKKGPDDIHIYWGQDDSPVYSPKLPKPHKLSRPFEGLVTSWLQTALKYNADMRGGRFRRSAGEDAPCLTNMEHILTTKAVNVVCMATGNVYSFDIATLPTIMDLQQELQRHAAMPPSQQCMVLPRGTLLKHTDLTSVCVEDSNPGIVFVFTDSIEPSFKMMHHSIPPSVSNLIAHGEDKIPPDERKEVYSQVLFFIREQCSLFDHLLCGHRAIIPHMKEKCGAIAGQQQRLVQLYYGVISLGGFIRDVYMAEQKRLGVFHDQQKDMLTPNIPPAVISKTLCKWREEIPVLSENIQEVESLSKDVLHMQQETDTLQKLADELQANIYANEEAFRLFRHKYVTKAQGLYTECKANKGQVSVGQMHDLLLAAMQEADEIIRDKLNGFNFHRVFSSQQTHLVKLEDKLSALTDIRTKMTKIDEMRRQDMWDLMCHERKQGPFSPVHNGRDALQEGISPAILRQLTRSSTSSGGEYSFSRQVSQSSFDRAAFDRRASEVSSVSSSLDVSDPDVQEALSKFDKYVSKDENDKAIEKNSVLLSRLQSLPGATAVQQNGNTT